MPDAHSAAVTEAQAIVQTVIGGVLDRIRRNEVDEDNLSDAIFGECDSALTYTNTHYVCVFGLPDADDVIESGLCSEPQSFESVLAMQAFENLRQAVYAFDFTEALAVAEDAAIMMGQS